MKIFGYLLCILATVVALTMLFDVFFESIAGQAWFVLDIAMCLALAALTAIGIRDFISNGTGAMTPDALLSVFVFVAFTATWIDYEQGTELPNMHWLWIDAIVVVALLRGGTRILAARNDG